MAGRSKRFVHKLALNSFSVEILQMCLFKTHVKMHEKVAFKKIIIKHS